MVKNNTPQNKPSPFDSTITIRSMPAQLLPTATSSRCYPLNCSKQQTQHMHKPVFVPLSAPALKDEEQRYTEPCQRRQVCIVEECNLLIDSPWNGLDQDHFDQMWYTEEEMADMKQEAFEAAKRADKRKTNESSWQKSLGQAYLAFCKATSVDDLNGVLNMITNQRNLLVNPQDIEVLGLEKWLVRSFAKDRVRRRHIMMQEIMYWQYRDAGRRNSTSMPTENVQLDLVIGELCKDVSRSSRMFAFHVGRILAMQVDQ